MQEQGSTPPRADNETPWVLMRDCGNEAQLSVVEALLQDAGIEYTVENQYAGRAEAGLRFGGGIAARVLVPAERADDAQEALAEIDVNSPGEAEGDQGMPLAIKMVFVVICATIVGFILRAVF